MAYDNWYAKYKQEQQQTAKTATESLKVLGEQMIKLGQKETLRVEFSGSGDSGGIDSVEGWTEGKVGDTTDKVVPKALREEFKELVSDLMQNQDVDWWNNDGGSGWFEFDPTKPAEERFSFEISYNVSSSEVGATGAF